MMDELLGKELKELYLMDKKLTFKLNVQAIFGKYLIKMGILDKINSDIFDKEYDLICNYDFYYRNSLEFRELYQCYYNVLNDLVKMVSSLNWDNEMKLFSGYRYLFMNGYLSLKHKFSFSSKVPSAWELFGCNVMLGKGNCKHINSMFNDLLNINGFNSYVVSMFIDEYLISLGILNDDIFKILEKIVEKDRLLFDNVLDNNTNHVAVLFVDDVHSYFMDAMNDTIYCVDNNLNVYQDGHRFNFLYRDVYNKLYVDKKKLELNQVLKPSSRELLMNRLDDYYKVRNSCDDMIDIFENFYLEHKDMYSDVVEKRKVLIKAFNKYHVIKNKC